MLMFRKMIRAGFGTLFFMLLLSSAGAQQSDGLPPIYYLQDVTLSTPVKHTLPFLDNEAEALRAQGIADAKCSTCKNKFYGTPFPVNIDLISNSTLDIQSNGDKIYRYEISSSTALGMQFYFSNFYIPTGGQLHIINETTTRFLGGYTEANNPDNTNLPIQFGTQIIDGNTLVIQYYQPGWVTGTPQLVLKDVVHVWTKNGPYFDPNPNNPQNCMIDVVCPPGHSVNREATAVAMILGKDEQSNLFATCSGTLLNNKAQDGTPFFLTARHCYGGDEISTYTSDTWVFLFNHYNSNCQDDDSENYDANHTVYGADMLSAEDDNNLTSDFLLLKLKTNLEKISDMKVCYAGWSRDRQLVAEDDKIGVHHPGGNTKKVSSTTQAEYSDYLAQSGNQNGFFVRVKHWEEGATAPGSSGSPLFYHNKVIGQLTGGYSLCAGENPDNNSDYYGSFSTSWTAGDFGQHLANGTPNLMEVSTYCPVEPYITLTPFPSELPDVGMVCKAKLNEHGFTINDNYDPLVTEVCPANDIVIKRHFPSSAIPPGRYCQTREFHNEPMSDKQYFFTSSNCNDDNCSPYSGNTLTCICRWFDYFVAVTEVDFDLNPIGPEKNQWFKIRMPFWDFFDPGFKVNDYMPSGAVLTPGKYYRYKLAVISQYGGWREHTKYLHMYKDNLVLSNSTIDRKVWAKDVILNNCDVDNGVVKASTHIRLNNNSSVSFGRLEIDPNSCGDFVPNGIAQKMHTGDGENHAHTDFPNQPESLEDEEELLFNLYPNPATTNLIIENEEEVELTIFNVQGQLVETRRYPEGRHELSVESWPKGMYLFLNKETGKSKKIMIQ